MAWFLTPSHEKTQSMKEDESRAQPGTSEVLLTSSPTLMEDFQALLDAVFGTAGCHFWVNATVLTFPCTQLKIVWKVCLFLEDFWISFMLIIICFLSTTGTHCVKCQFASISAVQRKCFQQLTVPLFFLTDLDFTQIVTLANRQFTCFVCLFVTHWGHVIGFFPTTSAASLMRVDVYVSSEGATKTLTC